MVPLAKGDALDPRLSEAAEERAVVRHDDGPELLGEVEKGVVRGSVTLDCPIPAGETGGRAGVPVMGREEAEFLKDGRGHRDVDVAEEPPEFRVEVHPELEGHEEGVRVEEDRTRQRIRASASRYLALEVRIAPSSLRGD